ncbi:hypothetical protein BGY98DRAFT_1095902 [Russula aff. rugulosa BPL654]|nr:hypothetical protein BGY98DRAFT_1095902 [Russula aff. rugulosa BPL654]
MSATAPIVAFYDYALQPIPALAWVGAPISALDIAGGLRLALILRQVRELFHKEHMAKLSLSNTNVRRRSCVRNFAASLLMVFGGEAVVAPWLGLQPSFLLTSTVTLVYLGTGALVDSLPAVPELSLFTELPLSLLDGLTRALLLCDFVPPMITTHTSRAVSTSPYTMLLTAFIVANAGPFFVNIFSLLQPTPMAVITPPELLPYGWTATDLWVAPLVTGLYATLTHAQPFFAHLHALLFSFFSPFGLAPLSFQYATPGSPDPEGVVIPLEAADARAVCVLVLSALFGLRAVRTFGSGIAKSEPPLTGLVKNVPMPVLSASEGEVLEKELAARVAGAGKDMLEQPPPRAVSYLSLALLYDEQYKNPQRPPLLDLQIEPFLSIRNKSNSFTSDMSSRHTIPRVKVKIAPVGSANAREPDNSQNNNNNTNSQLRSSVATSRMPNRLSMFSRIHARMSWASLNVGAPRSVFQAETVYPPGHAEGRHAGLDMKVWSHGPYKCAVIRRSDASEDILRVKMYESYAQITVFIPHDFHGVVGRVGHSGRSISCSPAALFLKETNNLRFHDVPDVTEDLVLVRTEKVLHVCVAGQDPPLPRTGRVRRPHV